MSQSDQKTAKKPAKKADSFSEVEKAAMKERAKELKAEARASKNKASGESDVLAAIEAMPDSDRSMAARLHELVKLHAPILSPKTWYGMPAYARDGKVVCFFQSGHKYESRYSTFGFNDAAQLDDGVMWPTGFALKALDAAGEAQIVALLKKAVGS